MNSLRLDRLLEFLTSIQVLMATLWVGLAFFTAGLAVLMYTRWGVYRPLRKCMALSLLAHLLLAGYAATVEIVAPRVPPVEQIVHVSIGDGLGEKAAAGGTAPVLPRTNERPWEVFPSDAAIAPQTAVLERGKADKPVEPKRLVRAESAKLPSRPAVDHVALAEAKPLPPKTADTRAQSAASKLAVAIEAPAAQRRDAARPPGPAAAAPPGRLAADSSAEPARASSSDVPAALLQPVVPLPRMNATDAPEPFAVSTGPTNPMRLKVVEHAAGKVGDTAAGQDSAYGGGSERASAGPGAGAESLSGRSAAPSIAGLTVKRADGEEGGRGGGTGVGSATAALGLASISRSRGSDEQQPVPDAYRLRVAPNRAGITQSHGGTAETEVAVKAALKWLADNQAADGRWDPRTHDAGKDANVLGRSRQNAGGRADTGMTGLALLAFLGSGHTHLNGPYREDVRRGLEFLIRSQASDGNLGGQGALFEFMYCHAMATCALSEAYGMTRDDRLQAPLRWAIGYTVAAQDPVGGGWRYRPGDPGDTSQLGWQLLALKSAELAGIPISDQTRQGVIRYLRSVSSGKYGGRASYRPREQVSRTMSAEALLCWQLLGLAREHPACNEAGDYLLGELPGEGVYNLYYWYYATFSTYQLQGAYWQRWNDSLRPALVSRQVKEGPLAGSWDTGDLWGGHGGRVYTTALAALTLEVYYRFLPLYTGAELNTARAR